MSPSRKTYRNPLTVAAVAALALAACSDRQPVAPPAPTSSLVPTSIPNLAVATPGNGTGQCMETDIATLSNTNNTTPSCTANDIRIATAFPTAGGTLQCTPGTTVDVDITAELLATSGEGREDIGVWIGLNGGSARNGASCNHYNLVNGSKNTINTDNDACAGMVSTAGRALLPLGTIALSCNNVQTDAQGNTFLTVNSCVTWKVPGQNESCPVGYTTPGASYTDNAFRAATLPGTPAKCNCEGFSIAVEVVGRINIVKVTDPGSDPQDFSFAHTVGSNSNPTVTTPFVLDTDAGSAGTASSQLFANVKAGTYTFTEASVPGWDLTARSCKITNTNTDANFSTSVAGQISLTLAAGQDVTCTFTNKKRGTITIIKNAAGGDATFAFTGSGGAPVGNFNITTASGTGQQQFTNVPAGNYTVAEGALPAGWQFKNASCTAGGTVTGQSAAIVLPAGGNITCTFNNEKLGTITIIKNATGGNGTFGFTGSGGAPVGNFNLTTVGGTAQQQFTNVPAGNYTIAESSLPAGWSFVNASCTAGGTVTGQSAAIVLPAGGNVTCTFNNSAFGTIVIVKNTIGGNATFAFTGSGGAPVDNFNLTTVANTATKTFNNVPSGTYTIAEGTLPAGWSFKNASCTAGGTVTGQSASITVGPGVTVTCTFTNEQQGTITIIKNAAGGNATFAFTGSGGAPVGNFNLTTVGGTAQTVFNNVPAGTYTVAEGALPAGWSFKNASCTAGGTVSGQTATINLPAGGNITCTFNNEKLGTITIIKNAVGGNGTFAFTGTGGAPVGNFSITTVGNTGQQVFNNVPVGGPYVITETPVPAGWAINSVSCSAGGTANLPTRSASITIAAGASVTCTYTNTLQATVSLNKRENGALPLSRAWTFELRTGATLQNVGTTVGTGTANTTTGVVTFTPTYYAPGPYQLCETGIPVGWENNLSGFTPGGALPDPDNSTECVNVTLSSGANNLNTLLGIPYVDNTLPPQGDWRTIGYWKNWSSCSGGKQYAKAKALNELNRTLDGALGGIQIGDITFVGGDPSVDCWKARNILDKRTAVTSGPGTKMASDPAYNLAAQLLAARLNAKVAGSCTAVNTVIADAQAALDAINFTGFGSYTTAITAAGYTATQFNAWATTLDKYNNNTLTCQ